MIKKGWYKHFKGGYYYVMWSELIDKEPRFKYIADNFVCSNGKCTYSIEPKEVRDYE